MISYSCVHKGFRTSWTKSPSSLFAYSLIVSFFLDIFPFLKNLFLHFVRVRLHITTSQFMALRFLLKIHDKSQLRSCYRGPVVRILYFQWGAKAKKMSVGNILNNLNKAGYIYLKRISQSHCVITTKNNFFSYYRFNHPILKVDIRNFIYWPEGP